MAKYSLQEQYKHKLSRKINKAVRDYQLISDGDAVLIGLSGGKDSLALVEFLGDMSRIFHPRFSVKALHIVMTNIPYCSDLDYLQTHCQEYGVEFFVRETSFDRHTDSRKSPCFLCSWNRRKLLFETAQQLKCNKIALGHHRDDFLETLLMNMFFQGSIQSMTPLLQMDKFPIQMIRPLCLVSENELQSFANLRSYQKQVKNCPYERSSFRPEVRELIETLEQRHPGVKNSLWASMQHIYPQYLPLIEQKLHNRQS